MLDELDNVFDDHPSLDASLEDFENTSNAHRSPVFGLPSQHSGFRSEESDGEDEDATPNGERWSPPGFRRYDYVQGSGWYRHQPYLRKVDSLKPTVGLSPSQSREPSPQYEDAVESPTVGKRSDSESRDITVAAASVPLPTDADTPQEGRSSSPSRPIRDKEELEFKPESNNLSNCMLCLPWFSLPADWCQDTNLHHPCFKISGLPCAPKFNIANPWPLAMPIFGPSSTT